MTSVWGQLLLLVVFSFALAAVLSAFRDDEPVAIMKGTLRRAGLFAGTVLLFALASWLVGNTLLMP